MTYTVGLRDGDSKSITASQTRIEDGDLIFMGMFGQIEAAFSRGMWLTCVPYIDTPKKTATSQDRLNLLQP